jgi:adenine-specific DNA-methyltransferase
MAPRRAAVVATSAAPEETGPDPDPAQPVAPTQPSQPVEFGVRFERYAQPVAAVELVEDPARGVVGDGEGPTHLLVEGENLACLTVMAEDLAGQVSVAVLDPPYNTSTDPGVYADTFRPKWASRGEGHARWLSFMQPRLEAVRATLTPSGVCFITIDAREVWGLKLLCDEVFGEEQFLGAITVKVKAPAGLGQRSSFVFDVCEYVLCYARDARRVPRGAMRREPISAATARDYGRSLRHLGDPGTSQVVRGDRPFTVTTYPDAVVCPVPADERTPAAMVRWLPTAFRTTNAQGVARFADHIPAQGVASVTYTPTRGPAAGQSRTLHFLNGRLIAWLHNSAEVIDGAVVKRTRETNLWTDNLHQGLSREGGVAFPNGKKPVALIRRLLELSGHRSGTVLDCFAGSGTTAEAVLAANAGGADLRFVCITDNSQRMGDRFVADGGEHGICQAITHPRVAALFTGVRPDGAAIARAPGQLRHLRARPVPDA